jgi:uncharacterized membrane protein YeiH
VNGDAVALALAAVAARIYSFQMLGTVVFAVTGVLAVTRRGLDVFGALVLGLVTALGGGTLRDMMIRVPVFWTVDVNYVWAGLAGALAGFWIGPRLRSAYRGLLYLDGLGAALFAVTATDKVLALGLGAPTAVIMGVLTGIGGGLLRDVLAGRPTLLMSREIYATPILLGCILYVSLHGSAILVGRQGVLAITLIFALRAVAVRFHLQMPAWLTYQPAGEAQAPASQARDLT